MRDRTARVTIKTSLIVFLVFVPTFSISYHEFASVSLYCLLKAQLSQPKLWILDFISLAAIYLVHVAFSLRNIMASGKLYYQKLGFGTIGFLWGLCIYLISTLSLIYYNHETITLDLYLYYQLNHPIIFGVTSLVPFFYCLGYLAEKIIHKEEMRKQHTMEMVSQNEQLQKEIKMRQAREDELVEARKEALAGEKAKDQFLSNMSHEIRTPMNGVIGLTNLMLGTKLNKEQKKYITAIDYSAKNLMVLINQILDLSKINSEKLTLEYINFDVWETIHSVENTFMGAAMEKGIILRTIIDPSVPRSACGDPVRLNQVLLNLVGNALKFTEEGGVDIIVNAKNTDDGPRLSIQINDTGIGIEEDKLPHIFETFTQAGTETTRMYGGSGLGLAISKELVSLYGGRIRVESKIGKGSSFIFDIQLKTVDSTLTAVTPTQQKETTKPAINPNNIKILLADDNRVNQLVAKSTLLKEGFKHIDVAGTGQEVIDMIFEKEYDVILMDVQMPVMSGLDATRFIRNATEPPLSEIKILALTASAMKEDIDKCYEVGMDDHLPKPFTAQDLLSKLNQHLAEKNQ